MLPLGLEEVIEKHKDNPTDELAQEHNQMLRDFRKDFELPCWPYNDDDHMEHFKDWLVENSIFHYNDFLQWDGGKNVDGPIWSQPEQFYKDFDLTNVYYRSLVWLNMDQNSDDFLKARKWPYGDPEGKLLEKRIKEDPISSDELAWGELNKEQKFLEVDYLEPIRRDLKFEMKNNPISKIIKPEKKVGDLVSQKDQ